MNRSVLFILVSLIFTATLNTAETSSIFTDKGMKLSTLSAAETKKASKLKGSTTVSTVPNDQLPDLTRNMHDDLLEAASNGDLEELRDLFETNELAPVLSDEHISDPIEHWKKVSSDGSGRDQLASLAEILSLPAVKTKNGDFVWPYLSEIPLKKLTPKQQIDLFRLVGPKQAAEMLKLGTYTYFTTKIGKDGTWHHFKKPDKK